jgi:hypothetical protein
MSGITEAKARAEFGTPDATGPTPLQRLERHIDRSIARSIDSRFPGLVKDLAKAVADELREDEHGF